MACYKVHRGGPMGPDQIVCVPDGSPPPRGGVLIGGSAAPPSPPAAPPVYPPGYQMGGGFVGGSGGSAALFPGGGGIVVIPQAPQFSPGLYTPPPPMPAYTPNAAGPSYLPGYSFPVQPPPHQFGAGGSQLPQPLTPRPLVPPQPPAAAQQVQAPYHPYSGQCAGKHCAAALPPGTSARPVSS